MFRESRDLAARHVLSGLAPATEVQVTFAKPHELVALATIANREIPGVNMSPEGLAEFLGFDPECIFSFTRAGRLLGGVAFLYLNDRGFDALLLDEIDLKNPGREFLARPEEQVAAIYTWALAGHGRAVLGLGNVSAHLTTERFREADYFAQPSTPAGRDLLRALGFTPFPSFQPDLWCYPRHHFSGARLVPQAIAGVSSHDHF